MPVDLERIAVDHAGLADNLDWPGPQHSSSAGDDRREEQDTGQRKRHQPARGGTKFEHTHKLKMHDSNAESAAYSWLEYANFEKASA
jgi:hypothetical protein